jgi:hypothetical protein
MNQKLALSMFFGGLGTFLMSLAEFFSTHNSWHDMSSPAEIAHVMILTGAFCTTVAGALGTQLPRDKNTRVADKEPKANIVVTQIEEKKNED